MKKILALTSAIVSMFAVEASATLAKNGWDATDEARFDNNLRAFRSAIGVGAGDTIDTASALSAMSTRLTAIVGDTTNANLQTNFTLLTRAFTAGTAAGWTADLVDVSDAIAHRVGTRAAYNAVVGSILDANFPGAGGNALFTGAGLFAAGVAGAGGALWETLSTPANGTAGAVATAIIPQAIVAGDVNDNTFAQMDSDLRIMYRRAVRFTDANTADNTNAGARQAALAAINNRQNGVNAVPTEDQFTLHMATEFFVRAQIQAFK